MGLRIACDLDGTLADMDAALQREAQRLYGPDVDLHASADKFLESAEDVEDELAGGPEGFEAEAPVPPRGRALDKSELRRLWSHVGTIEDFWRSLGEIEPGAVAKLAALAVQHRWEILFVTQRPSSAGETTQIQSQRWLQAHGFELPSVFVNGTRGLVANALSLDAVLDDRPENCLDVLTDSKAIPLLIWRHKRETLPPGIAQTRIETFFAIEEALVRLVQMSADRSRKPSLLGRVRRAIGI